MTTMPNSFLLSLHIYFVLGDGLTSPAMRETNLCLSTACATIVQHKCGISAEHKTVAAKVRRVWADWCSLAKSSQRNFGLMDLFKHVALGGEPVVNKLPAQHTVLSHGADTVSVSRLPESSEVESKCHVIQLQLDLKNRQELDDKMRLYHPHLGVLVSIPQLYRGTIMFTVISEILRRLSISMFAWPPQHLRIRGNMYSPWGRDGGFKMHE
jgi:hypothetical protein